MPDKINPALIGVKLIGRTRSQTQVANEWLEPDHVTNSTVTWLKPIDKTRLLYRINSVLSNMGGRTTGRVALQSLRRAVEALPDPPPLEVIAPTLEAPQDGPQIHVLDREKVSIGGFLSEDRSGGHVERTEPDKEDSYRVLVQGSEWYPGFGLCGSDSDLWNNQGEFKPTIQGPNLWGYGLAGVIDNHGGTPAEIERKRAQGLLIRCSIGDLFQIEDPILGTLTYRLQFESRYGHVDRHNIMFERVEL